MWRSLSTIPATRPLQIRLLQIRDFRYTLQNARTNEILLIEGMNRFGPRSRQGGINISRYSMGSTEKWITKMTSLV
jgi:hypothetical protein